MATAKPRITITLTDRQHQVLRVISECGGKPMSTFIVEMLDAALPTLERMAVTFQKVKHAQDMERSKFLESMDRAQAAIEPVVMEAVGQFDLFLGSIEQAVEGAGDDNGKRSALSSPAPHEQPPSPPTNRGATHPQGERSKRRQDKGIQPISDKKVLKKKAA